MADALRGEDDAMYPCPCCGYLTMTFRDRGSFEICEVCGWEDDNVQFTDPDFTGGANKPSLREARQNYLRMGASDASRLGRVRAPRRAEIPPRPGRDKGLDRGP